MNDHSDEELMVMFAQGSTAAFETLFERHRDPVFNFIHRMLGLDRAAAEDLFQEIFIKIIKGRDLYTPDARFTTWLFTIARNHCLNFLKSRPYAESRRTASLDAAPEEGGVPEPAAAEPSAPAPLAAELEHALQALSAAQREVFLLHAVVGLSHAEAAAVLGITETNARVQYHRARTMLRERLGRALERPEARSTGSEIRNNFKSE